MKIANLLAAIAACTLIFAFNNSTSQTVDVNITPSSINQSACYDTFDVEMEISAFTTGCEIIFEANPGLIYNNIVSTDFSQTLLPNGIIFIANSNITVGSITFNVDMNSSAMCNLPVCNNCTNTGPCIEFSILSPCNPAGVSIPEYCFGLDIPSITISTNAASLDDALLFPSQVVQREFLIEGSTGKPDYFELTITPESDITYQSIEFQGFVNGVQAFSLPLLNSFPDPNIIQLFDQNNLELLLGTGNNFLGPNDHIRVIETIRMDEVATCDCSNLPCNPLVDFDIPSTNYSVKVFCNEDVTSTPCFDVGETLNVYSRAMITTTSYVFSTDNTWPATSTFNFLDACPPADGLTGVDVTIHVENRIINNNGLPAFFGSRQYDVIDFIINTEQFHFGNITLGNTPLGNMNSSSHPALIITSWATALGTFSRYQIDFSQFTVDPDGPGGLINALPIPGVPLNNGFNTLQEGGVFSIHLEDLRLSEASTDLFNTCGGQSPSFSGSYYFTHWTASLCQWSDENQNPIFFPTYFDTWRSINRFEGYSTGISDVTDIAPGNDDGNPEQARLCYDYISTNTTNHPLGLGFWSTYNPSITQCTNPNYEAFLTLPPAYILASPNVIVSIPGSMDPAQSLPIDISNFPEVSFNYTGLNISDPSEISLCFDVTIDCNDPEATVFGFNDISIEFRFWCDDDCPEQYRVIGCSSIEIFHHCPGTCPTSCVSAKSFSLNRTTFGYADENAYVNNSPPLNAIDVDPAFYNRVYECDVVQSDLKGNVVQMPSNGILTAELSYDPPGNGVGGFDGENLLQFESGSFEFYTPDDTYSNLLFTAPAIGSGTYIDLISPEKDLFRISADMISPVFGALSLNDLLPTGSYDIIFRGNFRITDINAPELAPSFYIIHQIRAQFIVVDGTGEIIADPANDVHHSSCDPWGDNLVFLKLIASVTVENLVGPNYQAHYYCQWLSDQCLLRYLIVTDVTGGYPLQDDFPNEYRPVFEYPDVIDISLPDGLTFESAFTDETINAPATWNCTADNTTAITTGIDISDPQHLIITDIHNNYPLARTMDKVGFTRQVMFLTFRRTCPLADDGFITINQLDLMTPAYALEPTCINNALGAMPQNANYNPGNEVLDLDISVPTIVNATSNVVDLNFEINHVGANNGISLQNCWVYVTSNYPGINGITIDGNQGFLGIPIIMDNTGFNGIISVDYDCTFNMNSIDPLPFTITIHYGNNCDSIPQYDPITLTLSPEPCWEDAIDIVIDPQPSILQVNITDIQVDDCGIITLGIDAFSGNGDVNNAILFLNNIPQGYTLSSSSTVDPSISLAPYLLGNNEIDIDAILSFFGELEFGSQTSANHNPLTFNLILMPDCDVVSGSQAFNVGLEGSTFCNVPIAANQDFASINYTPSSAFSAPTIHIDGPTSIECEDLAYWEIKALDIDPDFAGNIVLTACIPSNIICSFNSIPAYTNNLGNDCYEWIIPISGLSSFTVLINADICTTFNCDDYFLDASAYLVAPEQCCIECEICDVNTETTIAQLQISACCPNCSPDFTYNQLSDCEFQFDAINQGITDPDGCPFWTIYDPFGTGIEIFHDTYGFNYIFPETGSYQVCYTVCCNDEFITNCIYIEAVKCCEIPDDANIDWFQMDCAVSFTFLDQFEETYCVSVDWGDGTHDSYSDTNVSPYHPYECSGNYIVCVQIFCCDEPGNFIELCKSFDIVCPEPCCEVPESVNIGWFPMDCAVAFSFLDHLNPELCMTVYWGDGSFDDYNTIDISPYHEYDCSGTYTVCVRIYCCDNPDIILEDCKTFDIVCPDPCCELPTDWGAEWTLIHCGVLIDQTGNFGNELCMEVYVNGLIEYSGPFIQSLEQLFDCSGFYEVCLRVFCCDTPDVYLEACKEFNIECPDPCCELPTDWEIYYTPTLCGVIIEQSVTFSDDLCMNILVDGVISYTGPFEELYEVFFDCSGTYQVCVEIFCCDTPAISDKICNTFNIECPDPCCELPASFAVNWDNSDCTVIMNINPDLESESCIDILANNVVIYSGPIQYSYEYDFPCSGSFEICVRLYCCDNPLDYLEDCKTFVVDCPGNCCQTPTDWNAEFILSDCSLTIEQTGSFVDGLCMSISIDGDQIYYGPLITSYTIPFECSGIFEVIVQGFCCDIPSSLFYESQVIEINCTEPCCEQPEVLNIDWHLMDCAIGVSFLDHWGPEYCATIDWGDGSHTNYSDLQISPYHQYDCSGEYTICVTVFCCEDHNVAITVCETFNIECSKSCCEMPAEADWNLNWSIAQCGLVVESIGTYSEGLCMNVFINGIEEYNGPFVQNFEQFFDCSGFYEVCVRVFCCETPGDYLDACKEFNIECEQPCCEIPEAVLVDWAALHCGFYINVSNTPEPDLCMEIIIDGTNSIYAGPIINNYIHEFECSGNYEVCVRIYCCEDPSVFVDDCKEFNAICPDPCCDERVAYFEITEVEGECCYVFDPIEINDPHCHKWIVYDINDNYLYSTADYFLNFCIDPGETVRVCLYDCCIDENGNQQYIEHCEYVTCGCCEPKDFNWSVEQCTVTVDPYWAQPCQHNGIVWMDYGFGLTQDLSFNYNSNGTYTICMYYQCSGREPVLISCNTVEITDCCCRPLDFNLTVDNCTVCVIPVLPIDCDVTGKITFDFGDGSLISDVPCHTYDQDGTYLVSMYYECDNQHPVLIASEWVTIHCGDCRIDDIDFIWYEGIPCEWGLFEVFINPDPLDGEICGEWTIEGNSIPYTSEFMFYSFSNKGWQQVCLTLKCCDDNTGKTTTTHCERIFVCDGTPDKSLQNPGDGSEQSKNDLIIIPNPNSGAFLLNSKNGSEIFSIDIRDMAGKLVHTYTCDICKSQVQIDIPELSQGMYILNINTRNGSERIRMIIQH